MKKLKKLFILLMLSIFVIGINIFFFSRTQIPNEIIELENCAIYPSEIIEKKFQKDNEFFSGERSINLKFPQIYYSEKIVIDENEKNNLNRALFSISVGKISQVITEREWNDLKEYGVNYSITKATQNIISIKSFIQIETVKNSYQYCNGITIDLEKNILMNLSEFMVFDENLIQNFEDNKIEYTSSGKYSKEFVIEVLTNFIENYKKGYIDERTCFYLEKDKLNIIVPIDFGNSNFIIISF